MKLFSFNRKNFLHFSKKFIAQGAHYQNDNSNVALRGKFLKAKQADMPTLLWFPEMLDSTDSFEKWLKMPENKILNNRNVWMLYPRNFGNSDHHDSFNLQDVSEDINRFIKKENLTYVTVGGHGYGAKVASAFGSYYFEKVTGVMCIEGGPLDHSFHPSWVSLQDAIIACSKIKMNDTSLGEINKGIENSIKSSKWIKILKSNVIEGKENCYQWKFNMESLARNVKKNSYCDLSKWSESNGMYPGRAFIQFAEHSNWIYLPTNTIPFYKFFPKIEGTFPSMSFNFLQSDDQSESNHWLHENDTQSITLMNRMNRWLKLSDGVHNLLVDRSELGWYGIPERESGHLGVAGAEFVPEHVHHNYKYTDAYQKSKEARGKTAAPTGFFARLGKYSNEDQW